MGIYVGSNSAKKEISEMYIGNGAAKKEVTEAYAYRDGDVAQVFNKKGQQIFTSSGTFKVPNNVSSIDIFLVGGGGGSDGDAGGPTYVYDETVYTHHDYYAKSGGGGGGYTKTIKRYSVSPGSNYSIIVGDGTSCIWKTGDTPGCGGSSSAFGYSAAGGYSGVAANYTIQSGGYGGNGGSGGGGGGLYVEIINDKTGSCEATTNSGGNGGSDGSDGDLGYMGIWSFPWSLSGNLKSVGQGTTTRAFGESYGTLYAGGGAGYNNIGGYGGAGNHNNAGIDGTGGGAGCAADLAKSLSTGSLKGGSGIVIIRWGY